MVGSEEEGIYSFLLVNADPEAGNSPRSVCAPVPKAVADLQTPGFPPDFTAGVGEQAIRP